MSEQATERRRFIPPEYFRDGWSPNSTRSTALTNEATFSAMAAGEMPARPAKRLRCSFAESSDQRMSCCGQMPITACTDRSCFLTDLPKTKQSPREGSRMPASMLKVVVLPAPLWPSRQKSVSRGMPKLTWKTAVMCLCGKGR